MTTFCTIGHCITKMYSMTLVIVLVLTDDVSLHFMFLNHSQTINLAQKYLLLYDKSTIFSGISV